ncbi:AP-4 complex subunit mu [Raphidocelis subcapitata]|uniref:AP-4 complex subunit mu n=1 Tax=Raphidocelis subcapitata TaxID=307507 RepID=A0A2V0P3M3_9CHLO|nr:AP-4 complex subunit mu [Raphidocelis subcapitata]|eukprot:GBF92450.1 AP-4 complex subunit mu [Raphidocelis subcapitata]
MISQFFVLSPRGDVIIRRDYLGNVPKASTEIFFRNSKFYRGGDEAPPVFLIDGVTYLHIKDGGVQLVACTRDNVSPSFVLEFLRRISAIIRDYCGSLSEEAIRKNFVLIYELLDEVMDYGTPQSTSTEALKTFVLNEPTVVAPPSALKPLFGLQKGPTGVFKSVLDTARTDGKRRDEIFVDVVERLSMTFAPGGGVVAAQVDGAVQVKSYLAGNPPIKVKLNDDLLIAKRDAPYGGAGSGFGGFSAGDYAPEAGLVVLDDAYFHEAANLDAFDSERSISLVPPDGEFALLNYRTTHAIRPPFRLSVSVEPDGASDRKARVQLRLFSDVPQDKAASGLEVEVLAC